ncbi:MAG TPA: hypothetical protein VFV42_04555 [Acidimicrobiales bacterium]|nr:hypothetical protein [Acidimicrobiales bacterium]
MALLSSLPLLLVGSTTAVLAVLVARALRDDAVIDALRVEVRRIGETHRAVCSTRGARTGPPGAAGTPRRRRG